MRSISWSFAAALLVACVDNTGPGTATEGTTAAGTGTVPTTGDGCSVDADCPSVYCQRGVCDQAMCGSEPFPAGTEVDDYPGNCQHLVCDGKGGGSPLAADDDTPFDGKRDCKREVCEAGVPVFVADDLDLPNDDNDCSIDTCKEGTPNFEPRPVNSFCGPQGADFCHEDAACETCKQVTAACEDDSNTEPNETQVSARDLGTIDDADASGSEFCGVLKGAADIDWFKFSGKDVFLNYVDPTREVLSDGAVKLCVYLQCKDGGTSVNCDAGDSPAVAPLGQSGCCGTGTVAPNLNCAGTDDSATVWVSIANSAALACVGYQLNYHY